jgi:hypothetical protein
VPGQKTTNWLLVGDKKLECVDHSKDLLRRGRCHVPVVFVLGDEQLVPIYDPARLHA